MNMKWDELTSVDFPKAVEAAKGVCVLPFGVMEKHGDQLPLGTDQIVVEAVAERAVAREPAVLFPRYYFGQIHEAKQWPGAVAVRRQVLFDLLENVLEEIARNGLRKILIVNGHGGNEAFLRYFAFVHLERPRDYTLYIARCADYMTQAIESAEWKALVESSFEDHAGEAETSNVMAVRPDLVKMEYVAEPGLPQKRLAHLPSMLTSVWWYADFPNHYAGDAATARPDKGRFLIGRYAESLAAIIRAVKDDDVAARLEQEYFSRIRHGKAGRE